VKVAFVQAAVEEMAKQSAEAPLNARFPYFTGILLNHAGLYEDARLALERAHMLTPRKQSITFELGLNALVRGKNDEGVRYFKEAYDLAPEYNEAQVQYISALVRVGRAAEAEPLLRDRIEKGIAAHARIASAYAAAGRYDKIVEIWGAHIAQKPEDIDARLVLASAYYQLGNASRALQELNEIKKIAPQMSGEVDVFIKEMQSGKTVQ
jgi:tetratricopeptide (TPR) repeat protein